MLGITHFLFSITVYLFLILFGFPFWVIFFSIFGGFFPDIDSSSSFLGKHFKPFSWFFRHRGFFHSVYAAFLFSAMFLLVNFYASIGFLAGFTSHLLLDSMTRKGITPFLFGRTLRGPFRSGGVFEWSLLIVLILLNIYLTIIIL